MAESLWEDQAPFREGLEQFATAALERIGADLTSHAYLVGFALSDRGNLVDIEPASAFSPGVLSGVSSRAATLYTEHPDADTIHVDGRLHKAHHQRLRDRCRADALSEALAAMSSDGGHHFCVGRSAVIGRAAVYPVLRVDAKRWNALPRVPEHGPTPGTRLQTSLQDAVIDEVLRLATEAMAQRTPPANFNVWPDEVEAALRTAALRFLASAAFLAGDAVGGSLFASLNAVSVMPYEGRSSSGHLLLAPIDHGAVDVAVRFADPEAVSNGRALRKLLEISGPEHQLLCDRGRVWGLGRVDGRAPQADANYFSITVLGRGAWELHRNKLPLMRVVDAVPTLPSSTLLGLGVSW